MNENLSFFIIFLFIVYSSNLYANEVSMYCDMKEDKSGTPTVYKLVDAKYVLRYNTGDQLQCNTR